MRGVFILPFNQVLTGGLFGFVYVVSILHEPNLCVVIAFL